MFYFFITFLCLETCLNFMQKLNFCFYVFELSKISSVFDQEFDRHCVVIVSVNAVDPNKIALPWK